MPSPLDNFRILVADADQQIASVVSVVLMRMGFSNVTLTASGRDAIDLLKKNPFDFLIADWNLEDLDGIALINYIRCDPRSLNLTMPIVMLTGRAEQADILRARDHGINEYATKPFTANTLYSRLERIVELPREFVVSPTFTGPNRRSAAARATIERRSTKTKVERMPWDASPEMEVATPRIWQPDFSLKQKLGRNTTLSSIITPAILAQAQASIDAIAQKSLQWIKTDLDVLKLQSRSLKEGNFDVRDLGETALVISAKAGTFGYKVASEVAYMLYLFCRNRFDPRTKNHTVVIEKHIDVLQLILASGIKEAGKEVTQVIQELKTLTMKR